MKAVVGKWEIWYDVSEDYRLAVGHFPERR